MPEGPPDATGNNIQPLKDDLQQISNQLIDLRENVDSGLASTRQRIRDASLRFRHTETLLKTLSNEPAKVATSGLSVPLLNPQIGHLIQVVETLQRSLNTELSMIQESLDATRQNPRSFEPVTAPQETTR